MMKKTLISMACAAAMAAPAAQAELSANIGATSNYVWRGVTQTSDGAAISGGIDYSHQSGLYVGTWASNIDWGVGTSGYEWDVYGGFAGEFGDFGYDVGVIAYIYPTEAYDDSNFTELYASGSYKFLTVGINYTVDGDQPSDAAFSDGDYYLYASASFDLQDGWGIGGTVGYYDFDTPDSGDDYSHFQLDVTKSAGDFGDFTFSVSQAEDSNLSSDDTLVFVSWSKSF